MRKGYQMFWGLLILLAVLLSGCAGKSAGEAENGRSGAETEAPAGEEPSLGEEPPAGEEPSPGEEPPARTIAFEGMDMEGNAVSSGVFSQSKLTMVNVWATYCSPCLNEMPGLGELAAEYDAGEFQLIGIVSDVLEGEDQTLAEDLIRQTGAEYTHLLLNESIYNSLLTDVTAVPTTFFIDAEGTVLDTVIGAMEKPAWEEKINGLLEEL